MAETANYPAWRVSNPQAGFTDWLKAGADWGRATGHRFTTELSNGSLAESVFRRYLVQDYAFIESLVTVLGFLVARAPGMVAKKRFAGFLAELTSAENDYFLRAFEALGVADANSSTAELLPTTAALSALMAEAANAGTYEDLLAVVVPAEWIYRTWALANREAVPPQPHYLEWITLHTDPAFAGFVDWMIGELDRLGPELSEAGQSRIQNRFQRLVELEVAFFDQAYG